MKKSDKSQGNTKSGFPSLTPKNFKKYEDDISRRIQGMFYPDDIKYKPNLKYVNAATKRENCSDIYLNFRSFTRVSRSTSQLHKNYRMNELKQKLQKKHLKSSLDKLIPVLPNSSNRHRKSPHCL